MTTPLASAPLLAGEEFARRAREEFGPGFVAVIAARLRVSDRHVEAWVDGCTPIPNRHVEALDRLFQARQEARQLVGRFLAALNVKAREAGLAQADIAAALAADRAVQLACAALAAGQRQPLSRRQ